MRRNSVESPRLQGNPIHLNGHKRRILYKIFFRSNHFFKAKRTIKIKIRSYVTQRL